MKKLTLASLFLYSCATSAEVVFAPTGEEVLLALLKNGNMQLAEEPLCTMTYSPKESNPPTLSNYLSIILSTSYETENTNTIATKCEESKSDINGTTTDIWDCSLHVNEDNQSGEYISGSSTRFSLTLVEKELVKGSLRCF